MKKRVRITQDIFIERCQESHKGSNLDFSTSIFTKSNDYVEYTCSKHGKKKMRARHLMRGVGCPECSNTKQTQSKYLDTEEFIDRANKVHENLDFNEVEYVNTRTRIIVTCSEGHKFTAIPNNILNGRGCPKCSATKSNKEGELVSFVQEMVEEIIENDRELISPKEIDIVIPAKKLAIEFNGLFWHSDKNVGKDYHLNKTQDCKQEGYRLIHIFEDEWDHKKEIVKSRIRNILGRNSTKIYGRNTKVVEIDHRTAKGFLESNHIQGSINSKIRLGLYYKDKLVSIMTFGPLRRALGNSSKEGNYELLRFCNLKNTNVLGGASKLLRYFEKKYIPKRVISYADYRWSNGELYETLGFNYLGRSKPNYYYLDKGSRNRLQRFKYRKSELVKEGFDKEKTERQIMEDRGYSRIYDCGALRYEKKYNKLYIDY